jgi:osmotically inducible lipoprotein OsmB
MQRRCGKTTVHPRILLIAHAGESFPLRNNHQRFAMAHIKTRITATVVTVGLLLALGGCAASPQQRNTAVGAGVGAAAGAVLTNGSAVGTVGGAAVGGVIGHQVR